MSRLITTAPGAGYAVGEKFALPGRRRYAATPALSDFRRFSSIRLAARTIMHPERARGAAFLRKWFVFFRPFLFNAALLALLSELQLMQWLNCNPRRRTLYNGFNYSNHL